MSIQLSDHFNYRKIIRFTLPSIAMMIFTSIYGVVDGLFVSNFAGKTGFAAINFILPVLNILGTFGYMFGAGGSALISKTLGEGKREKANQFFSMFVYLSIALSVLMAVLGFAFMRPLSQWLGAEGQLLEDCVLYGRIFILALPAWILLYEFQLFFVTAEKPQLGLAVTVAAGVTNIVLDAVFIIVFKWGLAGAAAASALSQVVGGVFPLVYFGRPNSSILRLTKPIWDMKAILKGCTNGSSELMSGIASSFVGILYNVQLLNYAGENGVAAYGVMMYLSMIFASTFLGYCNGIAPVIGYHYGAQNHGELKSLLKKSLTIMGICSAGMLLLSEILATPISKIFVGYDQALLELTIHGFRIFSFSFLFMGLGIFGSSFFTALNNGLISALISFLRVLVFQMGAVLLLPMFFDVDGIWMSVAIAELIAAVISITFIATLRKKYRY